jgi:D-alanine transaminase
VACVTARDFRWERGDIKSTSLLGNVLARQMSADHGALETIMFRDGYLTEASASNVWIVHEGALLGPPKSEHVLEGIRVDLLRELCEELRHRLQPAPDLRGRRARRRRGAAQLGHQGGAARHRIDGEPVGHGALRGKPGPVYARLYEAYQRAKQTQSI